MIVGTRRRRPANNIRSAYRTRRIAASPGWQNNPRLSLLPDSNTFEVRRPLVYIDARGRRHVVPRLFRSDGASIPQWAWVLVGSPLDRRYRRAAALHDFHFVTRSVSAMEAHRIFREALLASGVHPVKAWAFYAAVTAHRPRW